MGQYSNLVEEHKRKSQHIWGCQSLIHHCHEIWRTAIRLAVDGGHWEFVHPLIEAWRILGSPRSHSLEETTGFGTPLEACCNLRCPSQALHISSQSFLLARTSGCSIWLYLAVLSRPNRLIAFGDFTSQWSLVRMDPQQQWALTGGSAISSDGYLGKRSGAGQVSMTCRHLFASLQQNHKLGDLEALFTCYSDKVPVSR